MNEGQGQIDEVIDRTIRFTDPHAVHADCRRTDVRLSLVLQNSLAHTVGNNVLQALGPQIAEQLETRFRDFDDDVVHDFPFVLAQGCRKVGNGDRVLDDLSADLFIDRNERTTAVADIRSKASNIKVIGKHGGGDVATGLSPEKIFHLRWRIVQHEFFLPGFEDCIVTIPEHKLWNDYYTSRMAQNSSVV